MRYLALATALALVGALFLAQAHRILVRHAYCSDHGALVHPRRPQHPPGTPPGAGQRSLHDEHRVAGIHGCLALTFITTPWLRPASRAPGAQQAMMSESSPAQTSTPTPAVSRLRQAPKQSPPRA